MDYTLNIKGKEYSYKKEGNQILVNSEELSTNLQWIKPGEFLTVSLNNQNYRIVILKKEGKQVKLSVNGQILEVSIADPMDLLLKNLGLDKLMNKAADSVKAPMPGLVLKVMVQPGDVVKKGDPLLILEAMKMENVIKSPTDGQIKEVKVSEKQAVDKNALMIVF
jgi:biotin carboxyl carrier protein